MPSDDLGARKKLTSGVDLPARTSQLLGLSIHSLRDDLPSAVHYAEQSLRFSEKAGDDRSILVSLDALGKAYELSGFLEKAAACRVRQLDISRHSDDDLQALKALVGMSSLHLSLSEFIRAQHILDSAWGLVDRMVEKVPAILLVEIHTNYGLSLLGHGDFSDAGRVFAEAFRLFGSDSEPGSAHLLLSLAHGRWLMETGRRDSARSVFLSSWVASRNIGDLSSMSAAAWSLGHLSEVDGLPIEARSYFLEAFRIARFAGASRWVEASAKRLARIFQTTGNMDSSVAYYMIANESIRQLDERNAAERLSIQQLPLHVGKRQEKSINDDQPLDWVSLFAAFCLIVVSGRLFFHYLLGSKMIIPIPVDPEKNDVRPQTSTEHKSVGLAQTFVGQGENDLANPLEGVMLNERIENILKSLRKSLPFLESCRRDGLEKAIRELETKRDDNIWEEFEVRIESMFQGFTEKMRESMPKLSHNERRLCLLLRMDLNTKEISRLTGQSVRAVELGRIRLRKKLNLTHSDAGLNEYLSSL